ncbi:Hsp20/alpha crystallin family protein [Streptomyces sp. NPDC054797]
MVGRRDARKSRWGWYRTPPWEPADDVEETDDAYVAYVLELGLPGLREDQVTVEVLDSELAVHGET